MSALKDIVDLAKDLESRAKDRKDMESIHKIQELVFSLQSSYLDIVERDVKLTQDNADLKRQLEESQSEDVRILGAIEFRKGKRTGGNWMPFCPKCKMPGWVPENPQEYINCSANCGWVSNVAQFQLAHFTAQLK